MDVSDVDAVAMRLHLSGTEVDRVDRPGGNWERIWVGRVTSLEKHPNADRLQLAVVEYGEGRQKTVVTGATNLSKGDVVPYAESGAVLIDGHSGQSFTLEPKPVRGIASEGMLCSARELGLGEDHDGILQLDRNLAVGARLADVIGEAIIQCEVAPNRPDVLSIRGVAREVAALQGSTVRSPALAKLPASLEPAQLRVRIDDPERCPRFAAAYLDSIQQGPSPHWMQERLATAGMRAISNVVDITNYVMLEYGQPLHAYDAEKLSGRSLVARRAQHGERLLTLDGIDRELAQDDLVIADEARPLGLAGVMGGVESGIGEGTASVALECASFEPTGIRRSSERHGLQGSNGSAAARRFSLALSPEFVPEALARAVQLLIEHAGARLIGAIDVYPRPIQRRKVRLASGDVNRILGADITPLETANALRQLGFEVNEDPAGFDVIAPAVRTDISIPEDLVEEVARIVGYDRIPTRLPTGPLRAHQPHPLEQFRERVRDALVGLGLQETVSYPAIDSEWLVRLTGDGTPIAPEPILITNPTSTALSAMRPTLRASLLDTAQRNLRHLEGVAIFEIGAVYLPRPRDLPEERLTAGILLSGITESEAWMATPRPWEISDIRGIVAAVHEALGIQRVGERSVSVPGLHPGRSMRATLEGRDLVRIGQLDPRVAQMWELPSATFIAELDLELLATQLRRTLAAQPPRYPAARRDIALIVDEAKPYGDVSKAILEAAKGMVESVTLLDIYRGPQVGEGKKSLAVRLVLRSNEGTLADADIEKAMRRIQGRLLHQLGALIR